ncbi:hypothetical protein [Nonomuraea turcica]|uniref:hypothetical protein n=1 Tax=Nonomuraea sp. G32 TaxID=3067274 RepID=UPI00273CEFEB|nr:hypothetical protein [Nonomuraea sp. G32]MDP4501043.1 hypothetical protein [Nonomuraea sp. G32]
MSGTRGGNGRYTRDPATAHRDAEACRLRARGLTYQQIADQLGTTRSNAYEAVQRAIADIVREPAEEVRQLELMRLDEMHTAALAILEARHFVVDRGEVVEWEGAPLIDDGPKLAAIDRLLKIQARRAALLGLDAEKKVSVSGGVKYEVVGVDPDQLK